MYGFSFDVAHLFAGGLVLVSFMMLYQARMYGLINVFALHAVALVLAVFWQGYIQNAPSLYITATIALSVPFLFSLGMDRPVVQAPGPTTPPVGVTDGYLQFDDAAGDFLVTQSPDPIALDLGEETCNQALLLDYGDNPKYEWIGDPGHGTLAKAK